MTPAIMLPFVIPATVAVTLTVLLIKERDYLFNKNKRSKSLRNEKKDKTDHHHSDRNRNDHGHVDYSGGLMGL